jgi:hypothetical protein
LQAYKGVFEEPKRLLPNREVKHEISVVVLLYVSKYLVVQEMHPKRK